jgi:hypothetical protein
MKHLLLIAFAAFLISGCNLLSGDREVTFYLDPELMERVEDFPSRYEWRRPTSELTDANYSTAAAFARLGRSWQRLPHEWQSFDHRTARLHATFEPGAVTFTVDVLPYRDQYARHPTDLGLIPIRVTVRR